MMETNMNTLNLARVMAVAALAVIAMGPAPAAQAAPDEVCKAVAKHDPDNDGTLDLNEVKAAAKAAFVKHNPDNDGTLDIKEAKGLLNKKEFQKANPDNDGTIDEAEYMAVVETRFKAANPDNDGTVDCKELKSKPGRKLKKLLKS
jgi:Ca2+-binding EF-hand superfamily protein